MTAPSDRAMQIWREACEASQEAWHTVGEQPNDPEGVEQGRLSDQAAARVIDRALSAMTDPLAMAKAMQERCAEAAISQQYPDHHINAAFRAGDTSPFMHNAACTEVAVAILAIDPATLEVNRAAD